MKASQRGVLVRFAVIVGVTMGTFYALNATSVYQQWFFRPYLRRVADAAAWLLAWLGQDGVIGSATSVASMRFSLNIEQGCDGIEPTVLFAALVLAFPGRPGRKLVGIAVGSAAMLTLNLARVVSLFLVGVYDPQWFHVMHVDVWQVIFVLAAVACFGAWLVWSAPREAVADQTPS